MLSRTLVDGMFLFCFVNPKVTTRLKTKSSAMRRVLFMIYFRPLPIFVYYHDHYNGHVQALERERHY